jgi:hypothetical protein
MRRLLASLLLAGGLLAAPAEDLPGRSTGQGAASAPAAGKPAQPARPETRPSAPAPAEKPEAPRGRRDKAGRIAAINRRLYRLLEAGKHAECQPLLKQILQIDPSNSVAWYNLACCHSRVGEKDKAVESLDKAVEHGYSGFRHLERDPDLDAIRDTPGYKRLIARKDEVQRRRAAKIRDELRRRFGEGYLHEIDHDRRLVFATNVDRQTLDEMKQRLSAYASAQWKDLFTYPFEQYLTIVIPRSSDWPTHPSVGGFYARGAHVLYARTVGMTLIHEFTHALHGADQDGLGQEHPIWITEGLAALFESSKLVAGHVVPQPNRRLNILQEIVKRKRTLPFQELVKYSHAEFMKKTTTAYAQSGYMMTYLQRKGLLKKWYDAYTDGYERDRSGAKAMEKVLGKKLAEIEEDWKQWVGKLETPILWLPAKHAYIGIQLRAAVDGVRIMRVVPGSGADQAGLKADDVILRIDDERVIDPGRLMSIVYEHGVGDRIEVRYRRDGEYRTATVTLGAMPERMAPPAPPPKAPRRPATSPKPASRPATSPARKKAA